MRSKNNGNTNANKSVSYSNDSQGETQNNQKYGIIGYQHEFIKDSQQMSKQSSIYGNNPIHSNIYQKNDNGF